MMNIASIMAKVVPGTFVPDMSASEAPTIAPIPGAETAASAGLSSGVPGGNAPSATSPVAEIPSFKDTVKGLLEDVNDKLSGSDKNVRDLASGKTKDLNTVVTSVEEANLSLQYTMAIRTKLLDAYSEVERMAV